MWTMQGFMENRAAKQAEQARKQAALTRDAALARDVTSMPASPKAARAYTKALKKSRPAATTDQAGNPYSPITQVEPGKNQKQRQKWQDSANRTRTAPRRPQP